MAMPRGHVKAPAFMERVQLDTTNLENNSPHQVKFKMHKTYDAMKPPIEASSNAQRGNTRMPFAVPKPKNGNK